MRVRGISLLVFEFLETAPHPTRSRKRGEGGKWRRASNTFASCTGDTTMLTSPRTSRRQLHQHGRRRSFRRPIRVGKLDRLRHGTTVEDRGSTTRGHLMALTGPCVSDETAWIVRPAMRKSTRACIRRCRLAHEGLSAFVLVVHHIV